MKTYYKAILAASICLMMSVTAHAGHQHDKGHLMDRMDRQHQRIAHGIETHRLTCKEAKVLKKQQRQMRRLARQFRKDGYLSKKERRILNRKLDKASEQIWSFKHNSRNRHIRHSRHYDKHRHDYGLDFCQPCRHQSI